MSHTNTTQIFQEIVCRMLEAGNPNKIILFGSRARGAAKPDSDYDLLVIEPSKLPRYKRAASYRRVLAGIGFSKDILVWTPDEVQEWHEVPTAFITVALKEGIILYERPE